MTIATNGMASKGQRNATAGKRQAKAKPTTATRSTATRSSATRSSTTHAVAKHPASTRSTPKRSTPKRIRRGDLPAHANEVLAGLLALYPDAHCELDYRSPWELLVATILSAQCTDKRVNMVTPTLFATYPSPQALAAAPQEAVEDIIRSTGFFRAKAKNLIAVAGAVADRHAGNVPADMDALVALPGVGRKTANVVLGNAFNINAGVVVDTHVTRLAGRLGLTRETDPVKIERDLMGLFAQQHWTMLSHLLIWHGRRVCDARKPRCAECTLALLCPSSTMPASRTTSRQSPLPRTHPAP